jgi:formyl-CoA transferase
MTTQIEEKLKVNKKMIGQTVYVQEKESSNWYGEVVDAADHESVLDGDHSGPQCVAANNTPLELADGFATIAVPGDLEFHGVAAAFGVDTSDPDLATLHDRVRHPEKARAVHRAVREASPTTTIAEAEVALAARGVPFGIVRAVDEVVTDPQVLANELFEEHTHPAAGRIRQHRPPTRFHGTPAGLRERSAPTIGQHTDEVVAGTGRGDRLDELRSAGVIG